MMAGGEWRRLPVRVHRLLRSLAGALYTHRRLIWQMALHDLRARYAATLAGTLWAILNPVITIVAFWFVSAYGLRISFESGPPYFLFMLCGFIPWMVFSEGLSNGTGAVLSHTYLVTKIAFPLEILPVVSIASAILIHLLLVLLLVVILLVSGAPVTLHFLQALYFLAALSVFTAGLAWLFSALNVFHRDVGQGLTAFMPIWFWSTPILWPAQNLSRRALRVMQLNPVFYVVEGYRNAFLHGRSLAAQWPLDLYFWGVTAVIVVAGAAVFRRLRPHFADVL